MNTRTAFQQEGDQCAEDAASSETTVKFDLLRIFAALLAQPPRAWSGVTVTGS